MRMPDSAGFGVRGRYGGIGSDFVAGPSRWRSAELSTARRRCGPGGTVSRGIQIPTTSVASKQLSNHC